MTIDCNDYRNNIEYLKNFLKDKSIKEQYEEIGMLSIVTNVPIIVVACYVGELCGFTIDLIDFINRLKTFYTIDKVINVRNNDSLHVL